MLVNCVRCIWSILMTLLNPKLVLLLPGHPFWLERSIRNAAALLIPGSARLCKPK